MGDKLRFVIYGAGDNGAEIAKAIKYENKHPNYDLVGFIDDRKTGDVLGFPILGTKKEVLPKLKEEGLENIAVTMLADIPWRLELCLELEQMGFKFPSFYSPSWEPLIKDGLLKLGKGVYIDESVRMMGVNQDIGDFSVIAYHVTLEGQVKIGKGVHLFSYCFVGNKTNIGDACRVGFYTAIIPGGITLGERSEIGTHLLIHHNVKPDEKVLGRQR
jgi:acetyltransferase-like isoleucine patch superfamily enzyme